MKILSRKKLTGVLNALLLCCGIIPAYSAESVIRFCSDKTSAVGNDRLAPNLWYAGALLVDEATSQAFSQCEVKEVMLRLGVTSAANVRVFISRNLAAEPVWSASVTPGAEGELLSVPVSQAFVIDGKPFFVGYMLQEPSMFNRPMAFDRQSGSPFRSNSRIAVAGSESEIAAEWQDAPSGLGNICVGCKVEGAVPGEYACLSGVNFGLYQQPDVSFPVSLPVVNLGVNAINSLTVDVTVGDGTPRSFTITPEVPVAAGECRTLSFPLSIPDEAVEETVRFGITAVGDKSNPAKGMADGPVICSSSLYPRAFVVEDYTGSKCGYCPIGYVAMDKLSEQFSDSVTPFIPIAVHNYSVSLVHCDSYDDFVSHYEFSSAPASIVNREETVSPSYNNLISVWDNMAGVSLGNVELSAFFTDESKENVAVTARSSFARSYSDADFGLAFVLTEDNVGPYMQDNYYNDDPSVPEFYQKGKNVLMMYNHVARTIVGWNGIAGSVPAEIVKGQGYPYDAEISLADCNNFETTRLICLLLNRSDGVIVNACSLDLKNVGVSGADPIGAGAARIVAGRGSVTVSGLNGVAEVLALSGSVVKEVTCVGDPIEVALPSGVYIVRAGDISDKVIVR